MNVPPFSSEARPIVTIGLSPAWQQILEFDLLHVGAVNRAMRATWYASGKSLNVARGLHTLGCEVLSLSICGGWTGQSLREEYARSGIPACWIETDTPTRVCTTILDRRQSLTTELVENQPPLTEESLRRFRELCREHLQTAAWCVVSGSLPAGCPVNSYADLMREHRQTRFFIDARGAELLECLPLKPLLVKPNRHELEQTLGHPLSSDQELVRGMQSLNSRGAEWVLVSQGAGPVWITSAEEVHCLSPQRVSRVVNPIGCGDSLLAGMVCALSRGGTLLEAAALGLECAARNAETLQPAQLAGIRFNQQRMQERQQ